MDACDVWIWRVWVLDKAVAGRVDHLEIEGEVAAFAHPRHLRNELIDLFCDLRVELAALLLQLRDTLDRREEEAFDGLDGTLLCLRRDFKI